MTEEKGLYVLPRSREVTPAIWEMVRSMAPVLHQARLFGVSSPEQAAAIMLKGYELGIGITASFELVQVVQGKPSLSPRGALALLHSAPEIKEIKIDRLVEGIKFVGYKCYMKRSNGFEYTAQWTMEDAKRAGLVKPESGWANYPENMCMWRAIGFCADVVAPDITAGLTASMKMPEAFGGTIDNGGNLVIDGNARDLVSPETVMPAAAVSPGPIMTLDQLLSLFGPEAVLKANDGKFPSSDDEVNTLGLKLALAGGVG
jgi:hypothetical protein